MRLISAWQVSLPYVRSGEGEGRCIVQLHTCSINIEYHYLRDKLATRGAKMNSGRYLSAARILGRPHKSRPSSCPQDCNAFMKRSLSANNHQSDKHHYVYRIRKSDRSTSEGHEGSGSTRRSTSFRKSLASATHG